MRHASAYLSTYETHALKEAEQATSLVPPSDIYRMRHVSANLIFFCLIVTCVVPKLSIPNPIPRHRTRVARQRLNSALKEH